MEHSEIYDSLLGVPDIKDKTKRISKPRLQRSMLESEKRSFLVEILEEDEKVNIDSAWGGKSSCQRLRMSEELDAIHIKGQASSLPRSLNTPAGGRPVQPQS